jgi:hypothetical protein
VTTSPSRRVTRSDPAGRTYLDIQNLARRNKRDTGELLQLYALEGFLDRMARSVFANRLVLKGGVLLAALDTRRPTRDIDMAAIAMDGEIEHILDVVRQIALLPIEDGLEFYPAAATAVAIRDEDEYGGVRVTMPVNLARARIRFHVDINIGDPIYPAPTRVELPRLLGDPIRLLGYPLAMVFAEKIVTAVQRGQANTRWRDFADIYLLSCRHNQKGDELADAVTAVATYRQATIRPLSAVLDKFEDIAQRQWEVWCRRQQLLAVVPANFQVVLAHGVRFSDPVLDGTARGQIWTPEFEAEGNRGTWFPLRPKTSGESYSA